jgi:hypothetical protein
MTPGEQLFGIFFDLLGQSLSLLLVNFFGVVFDQLIIPVLTSILESIIPMTTT